MNGNGNMALYNATSVLGSVQSALHVDRRHVDRRYKISQHEDTRREDKRRDI